MKTCTTHVKGCECHETAWARRLNEASNEGERLRVQLAQMTEERDAANTRWVNLRNAPQFSGRAGQSVCSHSNPDPLFCRECKAK